MARATLVSLRGYTRPGQPREDFLIICDSRNPQTGSFRSYWLDSQGQLREGTMGVLDALESVPLYAAESPALWEAVKARFGRLENRRDWKEEITDSGAGSYPEFLDDPEMTW